MKQISDKFQGNHDIIRLWYICIYFQSSDIDKYSRIIFPIFFASFHLMYWSIFLTISDVIVDDLVYLHWVSLKVRFEHTYYLTRIKTYFNFFSFSFRQNNLVKIFQYRAKLAKKLHFHFNLGKHDKLYKYLNLLNLII